MNSQRKQAIKSNEISEVTALTLGGFPQKILIDGRRKKNPLLLVLHGGPGSPIPFSVGCRGLFPRSPNALLSSVGISSGAGSTTARSETSFTFRIL